MQMASTGAASRGFIALLIGVQALLALVVLVGSLNYVIKTREDALTHQMTEVASAVLRAEEQLTQTLYLVGLSLSNLDELSGYSAGRYDPLVQQRLESIKRQMPVLRSLSFADRDGRIIVSSVPSNAGHQLDLEAFIPHTAADKSLILRIGPPQEGRDFADGRQTTTAEPARPHANTFIPVAMTLPGTDDVVVAVAAINPDFFLNRFLSVTGKAEVLLSVLDYSGLQLFGNYANLQAGLVSADQDVVAYAIERGIGQRLNHDADGEPVTLAFRASRNYPLVVIGKQSHEVALSVWRNDSHMLLAIAWGTLLLTLVTIAYLTRRVVLAQKKEERYQESQRLAASLFNRSNDGVIITDAANRILSVNPAFERITGYAANEILGLTPQLLSSGLHDQAFYQRMWSTLAEQDEWHGEIVNRRKNGSHFTEWLSIMVMRDSDGCVSGYIGLICDLSELKKNQQLIRQLSTAVEQSPSSIIITTLEPVIEYVNPFFTRITGYTAEEVIGQNPKILQSNLTPRETYKEMWARLESGETWQGEFINKRKDGTHYYEYATISPIRDATGNVVRYLAIKHDITERVQLERALMEAKDEAEAANRSKSEFLANMSHEIRTPLNGVLGMAQLLVYRSECDLQTRDYARIILHSGHSLLHLLNDILDLSKIEAGRMTFEDGVVMPVELLHEVENLFSASARDKGLKFVARFEGSAALRYRGDPHRLAQMLGNLVSNAIKFTHYGEITVDIRQMPGTQPGLTQFEFSVSDTGIGVPEDKRNMLFKAFTQLDGSTTRKFGGTGLGLSIVCKLVHAMGGQVGMEPGPDRGSRFWFRLDLEARTDDHDSKSQIRLPSGSQSIKTVPAGCLSGQVLMVEDHADNRVVIRAMLEHLGLVCLVETDGEAAVKLYEKEASRIDAVLMNVNMPALSGLQATRRIRDFETTAGLMATPIIAMTASAFAEDRDRCLSAGMNEYLSKPIDMALLATTLQPYLGMKTMASTEAADWCPLDLDDFARQVKVLMPLLAANRFDALKQFSALEALAHNTAVAQRLAEIRPAIEAFQFVVVRERLTDMLDALGIGPGSAT